MSTPVPAGFEIFRRRTTYGGLRDGEVSVSAISMLTITEAQWEAMGRPERVEELIDPTADPIPVAVRKLIPGSTHGVKVTRTTPNRHRVYLPHLLKAAGRKPGPARRYAAEIVGGALVFYPSRPKP